jgi:hypothetical protein
LLSVFSNAGDYNGPIEMLIELRGEDYVKRIFKDNYEEYVTSQGTEE